MSCVCGLLLPLGERSNVWTGPPIHRLGAFRDHLRIPQQRTGPSLAKPKAILTADMERFVWHLRYSREASSLAVE